MRLTDQDIEAIAQRIAGDMRGGGGASRASSSSAAASAPYKGTIPAGAMGVFDTVDEAA